MKPLPHNWSPRPYQKPAWGYLAAGGRRACLIWHRRSGKDDVGLHRIAVESVKRIGGYWTMLPEYSQGRKAIWNAVNPQTGKRRIDEAFPPWMIANRNDQEMFIRFTNGSTYQVVGSDRYDAAVGSTLAGIVFSEWALSNPAAWAYLAPILVESDGWAMFITTARGRNHAKTLLDMARRQQAAGKDWFAQVLTVEDTGFPLDRVEEQRVEYHGIFGQDEGDALIEQEYFCSFEAAVLGSFYGKQMADADRLGHVRSVPVNPDLPVDTAWDIGVSAGNEMSVWCFQRYPDHIDVVDYFEENGKGFDFFCAELDRRKYHGIDFVPHDAKVREAGAPGARTRIETMISLGRKPELVANQTIADGIHAARKTIPSCRFDELRTKRGLDCLRDYRREWDDKNLVFKKTPLHNWASNGADGFRYLSIAWRTPIAAQPKGPKLSFKPLPEMTYDEFMDIEDAPRKEKRI